MLMHSELEADVDHSNTRRLSELDARTHVQGIASCSCTMQAACGTTQRLCSGPGLQDAQEAHSVDPILHGAASSQTAAHPAKCALSPAHAERLSAINVLTWSGHSGRSERHAGCANPRMPGQAGYGAPRTAVSRPRPVPQPGSPGRSPAGRQHIALLAEVLDCMRSRLPQSVRLLAGSV